MKFAMPTPGNIKTPPVEEPPIVVTPPSGFFNVIRPPPPSFPGELTPPWVAVELPPSLMSQIMEQVGPGVPGVTMTPEMFKEIWEMTHPGSRTSPSPTRPLVGPIATSLPPGASNEWEEIIKREIKHKGSPIWLPMMGGSLAPAPGAPAVAPGTNQQGLAIKLP